MLCAESGGFASHLPIPPPSHSLSQPNPYPTISSHITPVPSPFTPSLPSIPPPTHPYPTPISPMSDVPNIPPL